MGSRQLVLGTKNGLFPQQREEIILFCRCFFYSIGKRPKRGIAMKKKLDKASVHNGRANSKGVAYNANHNTMELSREHQPHIDPDRIHLNRYIQYLDGGTAIAHKGGEGGYDSRKHEVDRYKQLYLCISTQRKHWRGTWHCGDDVFYEPGRQHRRSCGVLEIHNTFRIL